MYVKILLKLICALASVALSESTSIGELKGTLFASKICIEGSLSTITTESTQAFSIKELNSEEYIHFENASAVENTKSKKSAQSELAELAQHNEIQYYFKLEKEEGPPHNKIFTMSLTLGDENFLSKGTSLKKAKESLASIALGNTEYEKPPIKNNIEENEDALTPTVLLNNLSAKIGIGVTYFIVNKEGNYAIDEKPKKTYLQKLNESLYSDDDLHIRKDESQMKGPFNVKVQVGDTSFYGTSHTVQSARHEAASKAVDHLIKHIREGNAACLKEGSEEQCKQAKDNLKSPISLVYEAAQIRNLNLEFETISESGPPHKRTFVTQCRLGHLSTEGEGNSKKESKKAAAISMLSRISELPVVSQETLAKNLLKDKKNKKKKKVIKTNYDMVNMHINNFVGSVLDFGFPATKADNENPTDSSKTNKRSQTNKQKPLGKSYQDEMLELGNLLNFEVQFMDIDDKNQFYTLMSLHINPQHICLGQGPSEKTARNKAAKGGLKLLYDIGFDVHFKDQKYISMEREVKERIRSLLHPEIYDESEK